MDEAKNTTGFKIVIVGLLLVIVILAVTSFFLYYAYERTRHSSSRKSIRWTR